MILASASQIRSTMLRNAGVTVTTDPARVDEAAIKHALQAEAASPRDIADALAEAKAKRISMRYSDALVLGADQILVCEDQVFDKPTSADEARAHLMALRGKTHTLHAAAVIAEGGNPVWRYVGTAHLTMRHFTEAFLDQYLVESGDTILSSVGCYHLEGRGAQLFSKIEGDYFTILGLPLLQVLGFLRTRGELPE